MRAGTIALWWSAFALFAGCGNPCESVCDEMAAFARDCGITVAEAEVVACGDEQRDQGRDQRKVCREFGDRVSIEQSWDCTEIRRYFPEQTAVGDANR